jgi:hypothetical protein
MFEDQTSTDYIPDRVCETILMQVKGEREEYILSLEKRFVPLEVCFGRKKFRTN